MKANTISSDDDIREAVIQMQDNLNEKNRQKLKMARAALLEPLIILAIAVIVGISLIPIIVTSFVKDSQNFTLEIAKSIENSIISHPGGSLPITSGPISYNDYEKIYYSTVNDLPNAGDYRNQHINVTAVDSTSFILCYTITNSSNGYTYDSRIGKLEKVESCQ